MTDWAALARSKILKTSGQGTAVTDETPEELVSAVMAVGSKCISDHSERVKDLKTPSQGTAVTAETGDAETIAAIRAHLIRLLPGADHPDFPEALAHALTMPDEAIRCFASSVSCAEWLEGCQ